MEAVANLKLVGAGETAENDEAVDAKKAVKTKAKQPAVVLTKASASDLLGALSRVSGAIERRATLPILSNVMLAKRGGIIEFTGSDMELQMRSTADLGMGNSEVTTTVNARKLADILKAMPGEQAITLKLDGEKMVVSGGKSKFTLQTLPASDFPLVVPAKDGTTTIKIEQAVLASLIDQVQYAMATTDIRFYLNGMLLETEGDTVRMVATDGHRLATSHAKVEGEMGKTSVIIPRKAVLELARLLKEGGGAAEIMLAANQATFRFDGLEFTTKLIQGQFPDYKRVIPTANKTQVTFERAMLLAALRRAELMCSEKFKGVAMVFSESTLEIKSTNGEQEEAQEEIGIDYEGAELKIGFNVSYLIGALENLDNDTVSFALANGNSSVLITDKDTPNLRAVVMPMRI